jgi:hypothetical protein
VALQSIHVPVVLRLGEWFYLDRLVIVARDEVGHSLSRVPLALEVEQTMERATPPLFSLRNDLLAESRLRPLRTGGFRFRARTICPEVSVVLEISATVVER